MGVQSVWWWCNGSAECLITVEWTSLMMNAEDGCECSMRRGTDFRKQKQLSESCQFNNNEAVKVQVTISTTTEFLNACRHWIIHQCDRRFCCKIMILQWNKWATFNTVITCHLNFMTLHIAHSWYNIQSKPAKVNSKCPQNTSVNKCYKFLLQGHKSAQFCMVKQLKQKPISQLL
jgi:hypothetical protein